MSERVRSAGRPPARPSRSRRSAEGRGAAGKTVRDETLALLERLGVTRIFGNPGSTEIPFLTNVPHELEFVLGLHEGAVVGMASGYALGTGAPAFVNLHTAAGLGNAVNAIVCARDNRIPLVIVVGQQDRRHLAFGPFLAARTLERLAGDYPVWSTQPADPAAVPGAIARAWHEAELRRGPALVVVPVGDWEQPLGDDWQGVEAPDRVLGAALPDPAAVAELAELIEGAGAPALVVGAGADTEAGWEGVVALAERLACPVWQDAFSSRHGFPQDHPLFAGHLPWSRRELRRALSGRDLVVAVGTPAFRLYLYEPGRLVEPGTRVAVVSDDPEDVMRSRCDLAVLGSPAAVCAGAAGQVEQRTGGSVEPFSRPPAPDPPAPGEPLRASHLVTALAERLPADGILVEESPSTRPEMLDRIATRSPLGFVAVANGALGFGLAASIGLRMALPKRPVLALLGDGSATYSVQALWSAARYRVGAVFVIVGNGRYAVMDELAEAHGGRGAWPGFASLDLATVARGFGCDAERITTYEELGARLDDVVATLATRETPLLLDVRVE
ncbi:MAG TPA: thiamine pyrophosphate-binding protein [Gaiella sp.]|nr:thiamine pyrophosphate-binding protein [Gaiella sp.]